MLDLEPGSADGRADRLYAVVRFDGSAGDPREVAGRSVAGVLLPFPTARCAELFALHHGLTDFDVTAVAIVAPPAADRRN